MNIPYDQIIAKANERKEALKRYEEAMIDVAGRFDDATMQENFAALLQLKNAIQNLDPEARSLLGPENLTAFYHWLDSVSVAWSRLKQHAACEKFTADQAFNVLMDRTVL